METETGIEKSSFLSPVKNISVLLLLGGIGSLLMVLPFLLFSLFLGIFYLITGIGFIVTSFGLRGMKKWALYSYTVIVVLGFIVSLYSFFTSHNIDKVQLISFGVEILILIYFWSISKKFT